MRVPFYAKRQQKVKRPHGSRAKFQSLGKQILESSNKTNFERSVQKLKDILDEEPGHEKLKA